MPMTVNNKTIYMVITVTVVSLFLVTVLWYRFPTYTLLLKESNSANLERIAEVLQNNDIDYRFDAKAGFIFVADRNLNRAKLILTARNLLVSNYPENTATAPATGPEYESNLQKPVLAQYTLEKELAKTIAGIDHVLSARVHLAISPNIPGNGGSASRASIVVKQSPGHHLTESQILSMSQLVAAGVADLRVENITIIDQSGKLLKSSGNNTSSVGSAGQFEFQRQVELNFADRVENILTPVLGPDNFRVEITADINRTNTGDIVKPAPHDSPTTNLKRLTISVLVDDKLLNTDDGQLVKVARSRTELEKITNLIKKAVGFNAERGDIVSVLNESFGASGKAAQTSLLPFWRQNWVFDVAKLFVFIIGSLLVSIYLFRAVSSLLKRPRSESAVAKVTKTKRNTPEAHATNLSASEEINTQNNEPKVNYEQLITKVRQVINDDPVLAANILKSWVRHNAG